MPDFAEWESFYVIVGGSAAALIGLQFVVMTLIAERPPRGVLEASAAFNTPTIVHFSVVLLLSAVMRIPWHAITALATGWGLVGAGGMIYTSVVIRRMLSQPAYKAQFEDWAAHAILPLAAYAALEVCAFEASSHPIEALLVVAGAVLMLLFVGIHNAWDAVAYYVLVVMPRERSEVK
jgi:hypothetical protein